MHLSSGGAYDCTGGYIYQYYGIHYETPTEELEMSAGDYIKLIQNPRHYFEHPLHFIEPESTLYYHLGEHFTLPVPGLMILLFTSDIIQHRKRHMLNGAGEVRGLIMISYFSS